MKRKPEKANQGFLNRLTPATGKFILLSLIFLGLLFFTSAIEVMLGIINHSAGTGFLELWGWSCLEDLKFYLTWLFPAYLVFLPLYFISATFAKSSFKSLFVLFFVIQLMLIIYYNTTLLMLGSDLFGYSIDEIMQTVGASGSISLISIIGFLLFLGLLIYSFFFLPKKLKLKSKFSFVLPVVSLLFILTGISKDLNAAELSSEFEADLVKNKAGHFFGAAYSYIDPEIYETDIYAESYLGEFLTQYANAEPMEFIDEAQYPFLHKELERDVLSPFFEVKEQSPNIVIIMVEGLGRAFSNRGAYLGNFTPFLDSLTTKSLYWPNFLSNGGRTFAVLPSLLGSQPFAKNGFMEMGNKMPDQVSLLNLLKSNGYSTSFYYGGDAEFDNMAAYLRKNKVDKIHNEEDFNSSYSKIPASASGFTWGYGDKELFRYYLNSKDEKKANPSLDVLLTVSMHSPFLIDEPEKYERIFEERMSDFGFSDEKKEKYRNYKDQYTSILFTDDAIKDLLANYSKREDFENTIFIITGDHRIPEIPMASKIDRYHVPLIVYSPLLNRTAEFESVSSHFDVTPSLVSFLKNNFGIRAPQANSFVGRGLDTTRSFQNIHYIPLKQTKTDIMDFVMNEYHLNGEDLYKLNREFSEQLVIDEAKKEELKAAFNHFRRKNSEIVEGKRLVPDSIIINYINL